MHCASGFLLNVVDVIPHISDPPGHDHEDVVVPLVLVVGATSLDEKKLLVPKDVVYHLQAGPRWLLCGGTYKKVYLELSQITIKTIG